MRVFITWVKGGVSDKIGVSRVCTAFIVSQVIGLLALLSFSFILSEVKNLPAMQETWVRSLSDSEITKAHVIVDRAELRLRAEKGLLEGTRVLERLTTELRYVPRASRPHSHLSLFLSPSGALQFRAVLVAKPSWVEGDSSKQD